MKIEFSKLIILQFIMTLLLGLGVVWLLHFLLDKTQENRVSTIVLIVSYVVQLLMGVMSFFIIAKISRKRGEYAGYTFLGLSFIKFLTYLVGFRIFFNQDDIVTKQEYAVFFIPYIIASVIEVFYLARTLNNVPIDRNKYINYPDEEE